MNRYEAVPYTAGPTPLVFPLYIAECAAAAHSALPESQPMRVLEIGCNDGTQLLWSASRLPGWEFWGIDNASTQLDKARAAIAGNGLSDRVKVAWVELDPDVSPCGDLLHDVILRACGGEPFDFVIVHGVFSWVSQKTAVRGAAGGILGALHKLLRENGLALVSYNTLPGWHLRRVARDVMLWAAGASQDAATAIALGGRALAHIAKRTQQPHYRSLLATELRVVGSANPSYIFHEHLSPHNHAWMFRDFAKELWHFKLRYIADAGLDFVDELIRCTEEPGDNIKLLTDRLEIEQWLDFVVCRTFRMSIVGREQDGPRMPVWDKDRLLALQAKYRQKRRTNETDRSGDRASDEPGTDRDRSVRSSDAEPQ